MKTILLLTAILFSSCAASFKFDEKSKGTLTSILCVDRDKSILQFQTDKPIITWYRSIKPVRLVKGREYELTFSSNDTAKVRRVFVKTIK